MGLNGFASKRGHRFPDSSRAANHIEIDELTEERYIKRPASKTIYEKLSEALLELERNRDVYLSEVDQEFGELEREYGLGIISSTETEAENSVSDQAKHPVPEDIHSS